MGAAHRSLLERGVVAAERGRVAEGLALIREAIARDPADAEAHAQLGRWLSRLHQQAEAEAAAERALALAPREARTHDTVGVILSRGGRHERAAACFGRAVALAPGNAGFQFNLASSLKFLGRFDAAEAAYEACLAADPRHWRAHSALSQLHRQTPESNHLARLQALLDAGGLAVDAELHLRHALAKELEDLGQYDDAFAHLVAGRSRKRATSGYDFSRDAELFDAAARAFPSPLPPDTGATTTAPIFVVGLPRTGTTLVERILASHSRVASAGESQNFGVLVKRAARTRSQTVLDPETIARSLDADLAAVGREYLERTRPPGDQPRFVDKLPLNFFYSGHIATALPGARVVVLRRDPLDTVIANFGQLFATTMPYYEYAYDLRDIARYWLAFDALIAHWRRVLPGRLHEVQYETLVDDSQPSIARLLEHCGLDWEPACLAFDRNPEAVATASAVQVRQPLYTSSVGRWRRYAAQLAPAIEILRAAGREV
ncbi:MAG TPA: sulfotransferase [Steroidobacteraceae bacterium]|nr:sulfotransferase [Steroidobacteraceae bacterium]